MIIRNTYLEDKVEGISDEFKKLYDIVEKDDYYYIDDSKYMIPKMAITVVSENKLWFEIRTRGVIISLSKEEKRINALVRMV